MANARYSDEVLDSLRSSLELGANYLLIRRRDHFQEVANNAQTGISEGLNTAWVVTTPTLYLSNTADANDPTAKAIGVDYVDLSVQTAGITSTAVQQQQMALYLFKGNNYASGG